jgi:predicted Zn-dependent peptidase
MLHRRSNIAAALLVAALFLPNAAAAQHLAVPRGPSGAEELRLQNGLRVVLEQRPWTSNVSFRLVIGVGTRHFDCSHRETPHLLEHLLFSGTTRHTETELEHLIQEHGGSWNAVTGTETTTYQLDIFDRYALLGLDALHEIMTDTVLTPQKIVRAKGIVYREEGGRPGPLRRMFYTFGLGKTAWKKANEWMLPGTGAICPGLVDMEQITEKDITQAFRTAYVPENMTLIAVGNIDRQELLDRISATFGSMPRAPKPHYRVVTPPEPQGGPDAVASTLLPFLGTGGSVSIAFRTAGRSHADAPALIVLSAYVHTKVYEQVRVQAGLSYAPEAEMFFQPDYGIFYATADAGTKDLERVHALMNALFGTLVSRKVPPAEVERTKRMILLQWAQGYETNAGLASLYAERLSLLDMQGGHLRRGLPGPFNRYEKEIEAVSADDLHRVSARYIRPERRVDITSAPTMSYTAFYSVIGSTVAIIAAVVGIRLRKARERKRRSPPLYLHKG